MPRVKITILERAKAYKDDDFYVSDNNILMCGICCVRLDWEKKDVLDKHIKTSGHTKKKEHKKLATEKGESSKRQITMSVSIENQKKAKVEKTVFIEDTVKMCLRANIPLEKMDHPAVRGYLEKYVKGSGDLPCADALRRNYAPKIGEMEKQLLKESLFGKDILIIADETTDCRGRCVFAILFKTATPTATQQVHLASCSFLDKANGTTCSQAIIEALNLYEIQFASVLGLVSDSARYMSTCFTALQIILGEHTIHFQCWAHKVNLVGDVFLTELQDVNSLVVDVKMAFLHGRKIKNAYLNYLGEHFPELRPKLFPSPVVTRWNSWFAAVIYLCDYIDAILEFFKQWEPQNASVKSVCKKGSKETMCVLKTKLTFVSETCKRIVELIKTLEGSKYPFAHLIWDNLMQLSGELKRYSEGAFPSGTQKLANEIKNDVIKSSTLASIKNCAIKSLTKLNTLMSPSPANNFYREAGNLFNPAKAGQCVNINCIKLIASKNMLPTFSCLTDDEFCDGYLYFHSQMKDHIREGNTVDLVQLLLAVSIAKPNFGAAALKTIWMPASSVDAERFLSSYCVVLSDRRTRMKEENLEVCNMLKFNS